MEAEPFSIAVAPSAAIEAIRRNHLDHEAAIRCLGFFYRVLAALSAAILGFLIFAIYTMREMGVATHDEVPPSGFFVILLHLHGFGLLAAVQFGVGTGFRKFDGRMRRPAILLALLGLPAFPYVSVISLYVIYLLFSRKTRYVFAPQYRQIMESTPRMHARPGFRTWTLIFLLLAMPILMALRAAIAISAQP